MNEGFRLFDPDRQESPEGILTREKIIEAINRHVEKYSITRELPDENGMIYLFEVTVPGENPGEVTEYTYQRKSAFGKNETSETNISVAHYLDGFPVIGFVLENYDEDQARWTGVPRPAHATPEIIKSLGLKIKIA